VVQAQDLDHRITRPKPLPDFRVLCDHPTREWGEDGHVLDAGVELVKLGTRGRDLGLRLIELCHQDVHPRLGVVELALDEVDARTRNAIAEAIGGLPKDKVHCSVLAADALKAAVKDYREREQS